MLTFRKILAIFLLMLCNTSFANIVTLSDCSQLRAPKTVLLIHAQWCGPCQKFLPKYIAVSNKPEFADWTFYHVINDDFHSVCGREIGAVPITFKKNMQASLLGDTSEGELENFLKGNQSFVDTKQVCKLEDKRK